MALLKDLAKKEESICGGHRACAGCGATIVVRQVLMSSDKPVIAVSATGCMEVVTTVFPYSAWKVPFLHVAFENSAAVGSGIEAAYQSLKRQGKLPADGEVRIVAFGGDGGTYDIGFQSLSGAMERGHDLLYVCYDNNAYMNTGVQRSSATPIGANTTTNPAGKVKQGKPQQRKDLTWIMAGHHIPYVAQASIGNWSDLTKKAEKAFSIRGPKFLNVLQPCQLGWGYDPKDTVQLGKLAIETCFWPLYEVENDVWKLNYKPKEKLPLAEFMKPQSRFKHLFKPENKDLLEQAQKEVDRRWEMLLLQCNAK
jgi:pyruvate ferredoxin oxidoreductase beta subunit